MKIIDLIKKKKLQKHKYFKMIKLIKQKICTNIISKEMTVYSDCRLRLHFYKIINNKIKKYIFQNNQKFKK